MTTTSVKPKKQRKAIYASPMHSKHKLISAHLTKALRGQFGRRSLPVRKGDEVVVVRGKYKKTSGKVASVDLKKRKVYVEGLKRKKISGQEVFVPIPASNLIITNPIMEDAQRKIVVERSMKKK